MDVGEVLTRDEADAVGEALDARAVEAMRAEMHAAVSLKRAAAFLARRAGRGFVAGVAAAYEAHDRRARR